MSRFAGNTFSYDGRFLILENVRHCKVFHLWHHELQLYLLVILKPLLDVLNGTFLEPQLAVPLPAHNTVVVLLQVAKKSHQRDESTDSQDPDNLEALELHEEVSLSHRNLGIGVDGEALIISESEVDVPVTSLSNPTTQRAVLLIEGQEIGKRVTVAQLASDFREQVEVLRVVEHLRRQSHLIIDTVDGFVESGELVNKIFWHERRVDLGVVVRQHVNVEVEEALPAIVRVEGPHTNRVDTDLRSCSKEVESRHDEADPVVTSDGPSQLLPALVHDDTFLQSEYEGLTNVDILVRRQFRSVHDDLVVCHVDPQLYLAVGTMRVSSTNGEPAFHTSLVWLASDSTSQLVDVASQVKQLALLRSLRHRVLKEVAIRVPQHLTANVKRKLFIPCHIDSVKLVPSTA